MGGSFYWAHSVVKNLSTNENIGYCFFVDADSSVGFNEVAINNFSVGIRVQVGRANIRVIPDTSFTTTITKVNTFINGWIGYAVSMPLRTDAVYTTLCNPGGSSFRFDYGKGIDGSKDKWVDVPATKGSAFVAPSGTNYLSVKFNPYLKRVRIRARLNIGTTNLSEGFVLLSFPATSTPGIPINHCGVGNADTNNIDTYGRYGSGFFTNVNGNNIDIKGWSFRVPASGEIPNTSGGFVMYDDEFSW
jgi:hypothetical protein